MRPGFSLATIHVVSLYSRIQHRDGIIATKVFLERSNKSTECIQFICDALEFVLTHNAFRFGEQWFEQRVRTAMGTLVAPTFANLFLALWEERVIYNVKNPFIRYIESWTRFIDDVMIVWSGSEVQFGDFLQYINENDINMTFTGTFGGSCIQFLDIQVELHVDTSQTMVFRKATATNSLLHRDS